VTEERLEIAAEQFLRRIESIRRLVQSVAVPDKDRALELARRKRANRLAPLERAARHAGNAEYGSVRPHLNAVINTDQAVAAMDADGQWRATMGTAIDLGVNRTLAIAPDHELLAKSSNTDRLVGHEARWKDRIPPVRQAELKQRLDLLGARLV